MNVNEQYKLLLKKILYEGYEYTDKKRDVKCKQISSHTLDIDLTEGFPAINLKKLYWKGVVGELLWFLRGDTNIKYLIDNDINIWNKDAYNWYLKNSNNKMIQLEFKEFLIAIIENDLPGKECKINYKYGDVGRNYGVQWRKLNEINNEGVHTDQISLLINNLKSDYPINRRHVITAWNPAELHKTTLPPCHWSFEILPRRLTTLERIQIFQPGTTNEGIVSDAENSISKFLTENNIPYYTFDLKWHQRSVDTYLGLPFNIASYALLAHIIGKLTNMLPKRLIGDLSNVHLYENSWNAARELTKRSAFKYELPTLNIVSQADFSLESCSLDDLLDEAEISDFKLKDYKSYPNIPVEMLSPIN